MSTFMSFIFDEAQVRIHQDEKGMLWFVAKDVCDILGIANASDSVATLDEDERGSIAITDGTSPLGGNPNMLIVSESGLYALIFRSRKPEAKSFRKWVTSEVLPSIRKTGSYELRMNMDEVKQLVRLPEPYKRDAFRRLLTQAGKHSDKSEGTRLMLNICCIFAAAETGAPMEQARMTF